MTSEAALSVGFGAFPPSGVVRVLGGGDVSGGGAGDGVVDEVAGHHLCGLISGVVDGDDDPSFLVGDLGDVAGVVVDPAEGSLFRIGDRDLAVVVVVAVSGCPVVVVAGDVLDCGGDEVGVVVVQVGRAAVMGLLVDGVLDWRTGDRERISGFVVRAGGGGRRRGDRIGDGGGGDASEFIVAVFGDQTGRRGDASEVALSVVLVDGDELGGGGPGGVAAGADLAFEKPRRNGAAPDSGFGAVGVLPRTVVAFRVGLGGPVAVVVVVEGGGVGVVLGVG